MTNFRRYKKVIGFYASDELKDQMVALAKQRNQKVSELARYAIEKLLEDDKQSKLAESYRKAGL